MTGRISLQNRNSREKAEKCEGTTPRAKRTKDGIGSMPKIAAVFRGLTEDARGLPVKHGVFSTVRIADSVSVIHRFFDEFYGPRV